MVVLTASAEATTSPLSVSVYCRGMQCVASARGGSGSYEGFEWGLADESWDGGSSSGADASGHCVSGLILGVNATVTDSNGATAGNSDLVFCP